jgi:heat shock protein HslJ
MKKTGIVLLAALALTFACGSDSGTGPTLQLFEIQWKLQALELGGGTIIDVPFPDDYTVLFRNDGNIEIRADCNGCGGVFEVKGNGISIDIHICTLIACPEGTLDSEFKAALQSVTRYELGGNKLALFFPGGVLRFCACPDG